MLDIASDLLLTSVLYNFNSLLLYNYLLMHYYMFMLLLRLISYIVLDMMYLLHFNNIMHLYSYNYLLMLLMHYSIFILHMMLDYLLMLYNNFTLDMSLFFIKHNSFMLDIVSVMLHSLSLYNINYLLLYNLSVMH